MEILTQRISIQPHQPKINQNLPPTPQIIKLFSAFSQIIPCTLVCRKTDNSILMMCIKFRIIFLLNCNDVNAG